MRAAVVFIVLFFHALFAPTHAHAGQSHAAPANFKLATADLTSKSGQLTNERQHPLVVDNEDEDCLRKYKVATRSVTFLSQYFIVLQNLLPTAVYSNDQPDLPYTSCRYLVQRVLRI